MIEPVFWQVDGRNVEVADWLYSSGLYEGWRTATGIVRPEDARRMPPRAQVVATLEDETVLWQGSRRGFAALADRAQLRAEGDGDPLERTFRRMMGQRRGTDGWTPQESSTWKLAPKRPIEVFVQPASIAFRVARNTALVQNDANGVVLSCEGARVLRVAFTLSGAMNTADDDFLRLRISRASAPDGALTTVADVTVDPGLLPKSVDQAIVADVAEDSLFLQLVKTTAGSNTTNASTDVLLAITDLRVNGLNTDDTFTVMEGFQAIAEAAGLTPDLVPAPLSILPFDHLASLPLSSLARLWAELQGLTYLGRGGVLQTARFGEQRVTVTRREHADLEALELLPPPTRIVVTFADAGGADRQVERSTGVPEGEGDFLVELPDPQADDELATNVAENLAKDAPNLRAQGRVRVTGTVEGVSPRLISPGYRLEIPDADEGLALSLPVTDVEHEAEWAMCGIRAPASDLAVYQRLKAGAQRSIHRLQGRDLRGLFPPALTEEPDEAPAS